jgi:hypothetical protein
MNKEQRTHVVGQIRSHAKWLLDNALLIHPIKPNEQEVAYALDNAGFTLLERPVYQVTLPPTEVHTANEIILNAYATAINALVGQYTDDILNASQDNPATILNRFISDSAQITLGA